MTRIAIVGAGLSGLVVARRLGDIADVTVFEKARAPGGRIATRYAGDFGWARLATAVGWADFGTSRDSADGTKDGRFSSSASMLFKNGLNLTASFGYGFRDAADPWNLYGKIGYKFLRIHAVSIQYSRTENLSAKNDKGDTFALAYVFSPWKGVEFYGSYFLHMLDRSQGSNPDNINIGFAGARVKF